MSTIKFEIALDADNPSMLWAASKFFAELAGMDKAEPKKTRTRTKAPVKEELKPATQEEVLIEQEVTPPTAPEEVIIEKPVDKEEEPKYAASDLRKKLGEITDKDPDFIKTKAKTKLSELGASNISKLDPAKYKEFMDFLNANNG